MGSFAIIRPATYLYIATEIWYGNVIPSCYLINSSDIKDYIMDKGWLNGVSKIYNRRKVKNEVREPPTRNTEENGENKNKRAKSKACPKRSKTNQNRIKPCQTSTTDNINEGASAQVEKKATKQSDVILHDLDGIQMTQRIPGDASMPRKSSKGNMNSSIKFKTTNPKYNETSVFCITDNSRVLFSPNARDKNVVTIKTDST